MYNITFVQGTLLKLRNTDHKILVLQSHAMKINYVIEKAGLAVLYQTNDPETIF